MKEWNNLLVSSSNCSYLSSMAYAGTKACSGKNIETYLFRNEEGDFAGGRYILKNLLYKTIRVSDILSGFIFKDEPDSNTWLYLLDHFILWSKSNNACFIRFNPWLPSAIAGEMTSYSRNLVSVLKEKGFIPVQPCRHTYWINLTRSEEEILKRMKRKTRYEIIRALKSDLITERFDTPSNDQFEIFWNLYQRLGHEKDLNTLGKEQLKKEFFALMDSGFASLFIVRCKNVAINVSLCSKVGRAAYLYGAMDPDFKSIPGCTSPGQIAQWEMIKYLKSINIKIYDLGFCPGPVPVASHPNYPIWRFKYGFGGDHVEYMPVFGKMLKPFRGRLFQLFKYRS